MNRVNDEIDGSEAAGEEGAPLPVVVLTRRKQAGQPSAPLVRNELFCYTFKTVMLRDAAHRLIKGPRKAP